MRTRIDMKSAAAGAGLVALLLLLAGAAGGGSESPPIGRFQIACTSTLCFLVDTATGQVWMMGDEDFRAPKLQGPSQEVAVQTNGFVGAWVAEDPNNNNVRLLLEPAGSAVATDGNGRYEGRWRLFGTRVVISIDDDVLTGELQPDGYLLLGEPGDEENRVRLRRAP
ncbi:MAG: hypothetical protein JW993_00130 [Sedimentisphaerales bacterium]|nr:hypothetical protein [Sedimentisphaerales bacterium]